MHLLFGQKYFRKTISLLVSFLLLLNSAGSAFAQSISFNKAELSKKFEESFNKMERNLEQSRNLKTLDSYSLSAFDLYGSDNIAKRLHEIHIDIFTNYTHNAVIQQALGIQNTPQEKTSFEEFSSNHNETINTSFKAAVSKLEEEYAKNKNQIEEVAKINFAYEEKKELAYSELDTWYRTNQINLTQKRRELLDNVVNEYKNYSSAYDKALEDSYRQLLAQLRTLVTKAFNLYKAAPENPKRAAILIQISYDILTSYPVNDKIFSEEQTETLLSLYRNTLEKENKNCIKNGRCNTEVSSIYGLALLSKKPNDITPDAYLIQNLMKKVLPQPFGQQIILMGFASILAMGSYDAARSFIASATENEQKIVSADLLSFQTPLQVIVQRQGYLLGPVSENGQYSLNEAETGNIWYDIALMLAENNQPKSLEILKQYGVQQCRIIIEKGISGDKKYIMDCRGIMPFIAGAIASGKSGAEGYSILPQAKGGEVILKDGTVYKTTDEQFRKSQETATFLMANLDNYAAQEGLDRASVFAKEILNMRFGDVPAYQERTIDLAIINKYQNIKRDSLGRNAIIDEARFIKRDKDYNFNQAASALAKAADIAFIAWCLYDLGKLAYKVKDIYKIVKLARMGSGMGIKARQITYLRSNLQAFQAIKVRNLKMTAKFKGIKQSFEVTMPDIALFANSNVKMPQAIKTAAKSAAEGGAIFKTTGFTSAHPVDQALKSVSFDPLNSAFKMDPALLSSSPEAMQIHGILNNAVGKINAAYKHGGIVEVKSKIYRKAVTKQIRDGFIKSKIESPFSANFLRSLERSKEIRFVPQNLLNEAKVRGTPLALYKDIDESVRLAPVSFDITKKLGGMKIKDIAEFMLATKENGATNLLMLAKDGRMFKPEFFKIPLPSNQMKTLAEFSLANPSVPLKLKLSPSVNNLAGMTKFWNRASARFADKAVQFGSEGSIFLKKDGQVIKTALKFDTDKKYRGISALIDERGRVSILNSEKGLSIKDGSFSLPKKELGSFAKIFENSPMTPFQAPLKLHIKGSLNKIGTLNFTSFISLSAASTGLAGPLAENFENITDTQATLITLAFPYAASGLAPLVAPFVKRFGATKILMTSMATACGATMLPVFFGYSGLGNIHRGNPDNPGLMPLYVSGALIGMSTALTRSAFNPIITEVGGNASTFKSMAFKSLSAFVMIAPPLLFQLPGYIKGNCDEKTYYKKSDGSFYLDSNRNPIEKQSLDFSFAYPILSALSGFATYKIAASRFSRDIGKVKGYTFAGVLGKGIKTGFAASAGGLVKEGFNSVKLLLGNSQFLLPTATGLLITSTESSFMFKYSQKRSDEYMRSFGLNTIFVPVASTTTVALTGFLLRINSKKFTKLMGGETNPATCKRIMRFSLATTAVGGAIMYTSNSPVGFYSGLAITSLGLANGFNGALLMGVDNLKAIKAPAELITSYKATFPIAQLGQAGGSLIFSNHADNLVEEDMSLSRNDALQKSLWIPCLFLIGAATLTGMSTGTINKNNINLFAKIPAGGWAIAKGITSNGYDTKPFRPTEVLPAAQNPSLSVFRDYRTAKDPQLLKVNYAMPKITYAQDASTL